MRFWQRGSTVDFRQRSYPQDNIRNEFRTDYFVQLLDKRRFEEGELVEPDTVVN